MTIKKTLVTAVTTGSLLLSTLTPAFADTVVAGNGAGSDNQALVTATNGISVVQSNAAHVDNSVDSHLSTGGNSANNLTNGNASILTGDALAGTSINNQLNMNQAQVTGTGNLGGGTTVITGNGAWSDNTAHTNSSNTTSLFQTNAADVNNHINTDATTGHNQADNLTGGNASIATGMAKALNTISTTANANWANVQGFGVGGSTNVVSGNGTFSQNDLHAQNDHSTTAVQNNSASVDNSVWAKLKTGGNSADNGTNSSASILTGDAVANTNISNLLNSNWAQLTNAGGTGSLNKILGNGAWSNSSLTDTSNGNVSAFGTNVADVNNHVSPWLSTGKNSVDNGTGSLFFFTDPSIRTGTAFQNTSVQTTSNSNNLGVVNIGGQDVAFQFDLPGMFSGLF